MACTEVDKGALARRHEGDRLDLVWLEGRDVGDEPSTDLGVCDCRWEGRKEEGHLTTREGKLRQHIYSRLRPLALAAHHFAVLGRGQARVGRSMAEHLLGNWVATPVEAVLDVLLAEVVLDWQLVAERASIAPLALSLGEEGAQMRLVAIVIGAGAIACNLLQHVVSC